MLPAGRRRSLGDIGASYVAPESAGADGRSTEARCFPKYLKYYFKYYLKYFKEQV